MQGTSLRLAWITSEANTELTEKPSSLEKQGTVTNVIYFTYYYYLTLVYVMKEHD